MRELMFGAHSEGAVTYLEREREVHVLVVQWVDRPRGAAH